MPATFSRTLRSLETDDRRAQSAAIGAAVALLSGWLAWLCLAPVAVYEVTDSARLEVEAAAHPIAARIDGQVLATRLAIGREAKAGDVLVELDAGAEQLALAEGRARAAALRARVEALRVEIDAEEASKEALRKASEIAAEESRARVREAEARAELAARQVKSLESLARANVASEDALSQARAEAEASRAAVEALKIATARLEQDRAVGQSDRRARIARLAREVVELEGLIAIEDASNRRLEREIELRVIRAPVDGRIGEVTDLRAGSVVRVGERLGAVVPAGAPRAIALFPVAGVGRIRPGQPARLRLDGFPWTRYGTLAATVSDLASEPKDGRVRVELALGDNSGSRIPIEHGETGQAEIEVERVSPALLVLRAAGELLRETPRRAPEGSAER